MFSSVQSLVVSDSLQPHGLHHTRPPCPSPTPGVNSHSCLLSWWCHPTISSSVIPFYSSLQSFPASGSYYNKCLSHLKNAIQQHIDWIWPVNWSSLAKLTHKIITVTNRFFSCISIHLFHWFCPLIFSP